MQDPRIGTIGVATALAASALALAPAASQAETPSFTCDASALRASVLGTSAIEPATAGGGGACRTDAAGIPLTLPSLLDAGVLTAGTTFDPVGPRAGATGEVTGLDVGLGSLLPEIDLPTQQLIDALPPVSVPIPDALLTLVRVLDPTFPSALSLDLREAVRAALPDRLSAASLLSADVLRSTAAAVCDAGAGSLTGSSQIVGLKALGQDVTLVDGVAQQALPLLNSASIDLSTLDLSKITVTPSLNGLTGTLLTSLQGLIGPVLASLPPIEIPATIAELSVKAPEQVSDGTTLTQRALHAKLTLAGRPILDAVAGEARAGRAGDCPAPPSGPPADPTPTPTAPAGPEARTAPVAGVGGLSAAEQLLACTDRKLVLLNVLAGARGVTLEGAADKHLVGRSVAIRLRATGKVVARAKVGADGFFHATAPLPAAKLRSSNAARYTAELGRDRSLPLKLARRMTLTKLVASGDRVTLTGRVARPLSNPVEPIRLVRRVSCRKSVVVKTFRPNADGTFKTTVSAPKDAIAAVYRLSTRVRKNTRNAKTYPTYTLPAGVDLDRR
jgi:hypothetical protein